MAKKKKSATKKSATKPAVPKPVVPVQRAAGEPVHERYCRHPRCLGMVSGNGCAEADCPVRA